MNKLSKLGIGGVTFEGIYYNGNEIEVMYVSELKCFGRKVKSSMKRRISSTFMKKILISWKL